MSSVQETLVSRGLPSWNDDEVCPASEVVALARLDQLSSRLWQMRDLHEGLEEVLDATIELLGADLGNIQIFDPSKGVLLIAAQRGFRQEFLDYFREVSVDDSSACGRALGSGERIIIEDTEADDLYKSLRPLARAAGYRAVQSTPLIGRSGELQGMISSHFHDTHRPSGLELHLLDSYARHATAFVERCKVDEAMRRSEEQLAIELAGMTRLHKLSLRLSEQRDVDEVMREVMEAAAGFLRAERATAQLVRSDDQTLRLVATQGFDETFAERFQTVTPDGVSTCAAALDRRERVIVENLASNSEFAEFAEIALPLGIRGVMSTPLMASDGAVIGVFTIYWDRPHSPSDHQMRLLDLYVQQAERQVERRVTEQVLRRSEQKLATEAADLEALRQLSLRVSATSDRTTALNDILDIAIPMVGAAKGNVQLYDATDDALKIVAHRGFDDEFLEYFKSVPAGYSCCGAAMEKRDRVIIEDVSSDERFSELSSVYVRHGFVAVQSTPLYTSDGRLLGMFSTHFAEPHRFSDRDLRVLDQLAQHAGRIIERTQAEQALRDRQVWLDGQREALEAAVDGAPLETSLGLLVRTAIKAVGQDARAGFYLANDEGTALYHVVGMPADYADAVDGFKVGPDSLACGLATATGRAILTADVKNEPLWQPWLWMAERFDYRACWSFPIHTAARRFVGTLAVYSRHPREASPRDQELCALLTHTASIIISRHKESEVRKQTEESLRKSEEALRDATRPREGSSPSWRARDQPPR